ncbi:hypothetical protein AMS62_27755, partial [Bacillus sp. FJAT-18019]
MDMISRTSLSRMYIPFKMNNEVIKSMFLADMLYSNPPTLSPGIVGRVQPLLPFQAGPQLAPQGAIGNLISTVAPLLPFQAGPQLAPQGAIGNLISTVAPLLPFQAGPQLAPQGILGSLVGSVAPLLPFQAG